MGWQVYPDIDDWWCPLCGKLPYDCECTQEDFERDYLDLTEVDYEYD